jgi:antitoxin component YwqK of YwqJK toxin-antitoxin module
MNWKLLLVAPLFAIAGQHMKNARVATIALATTVPGFYGPFTNSSAVYEPAIESILYNPDVHKKEVARNRIQAVGYRLEGQPHFIIHFRREELHGAWQSFYSNNQPSDSGVLIRNLPTGEWKTWYPNGQVKSIRNYSAEKYHYIKADLKRNHPKDQRYAITRMARTGTARYFQPRYDNNTGINPSLSLLQKIQRNTSGSDSTGYLPPFENCLHHGAFINFDANGNVKDSGQYVNGLQHGLWKETGNGSALQALGFYSHGIKRGQWKYYDGDGRLVYTERYTANGKRTDVHYFEK